MKLEEIYTGFSWDDFNHGMEQFFPAGRLTFTDFVERIQEGEYDGIFNLLFSMVMENITLEWTSIRSFIGTIMVVVFLSSFIAILRSSFQNKQIAEIAYYSNYLVMVLLFINMFGEITEISKNTLVQMEEFMKIFFPTYFMIVAASGGIKTGLVYFQLAGLVIYFIEKILIVFVVPFLSIYMFVVFMNGIWEEERLTFLIELIKKGLKLCFRIMMGAITGMGIIQSLIVPVAERVKGEGIYQLVEAIPGVGEITQGAMKMWVGSVVLVKNSIGIVGCIVLIFLTLLPMVKIAVVALSLKAASALLSVAGDKKIISCMNHVGSGVVLCLQTTGYGILFFLILIAITSYSTNGGF